MGPGVGPLPAGKGPPCVLGIENLKTGTGACPGGEDWVWEARGQARPGGDLQKLTQVWGLERSEQGCGGVRGAPVAL